MRSTSAVRSWPSKSGATSSPVTAYAQEGMELAYDEWLRGEPGADVPGFPAILNDLESTLRLAHDMMVDAPDVDEETKEPTGP